MRYEYISGLRRPWSDCANAQSDLGIRCPHKPQRHIFPWRCAFATKTLQMHILGPAIRERIFGHMRTAKAQISLRIRAVWSEPSLSANRIIRYYRMYEWTAKTRLVLCACAGLSEPVHFAHVRRHFFVWHGPFDRLERNRGQLRSNSQFIQLAYIWPNNDAS